MTGKTMYFGMVCSAMLLATIVFLGHPAQCQEGGPKGLPGAPKVTLPDSPKMTNKYPGNDLSGINENDARALVMVNDVPWRGVGRLDNASGHCTGALIARDVVMTAAHCVVDQRTRKFAEPSTLHFMLGYDNGKFAADANGVAVKVHDNYDPILNIGTVGHDWALIRIDHPLGTPDRLLPLREGTPGAGTPLALGGYSKDHIETLMADTTCHVRGLMFDREGLPLVAHDCSATHGVSGAPLLVKDPSGWSIGGIEVVGSGKGGGGASLLVEVKDALPKLGPAQ